MIRRPRPGRTERRKTTAALQLTERDLAVLTLIGRVRYLSTAQITWTFFPSADRALRRLRQLFDAKLVAFTLLSSRHPTLVSLTRHGVAEVAKREPELAESLGLAGPIRASGVRHHLMVVDARLYAAEVAPLRGAELARWSNPGGGLHRELGVSAFGLAPDGLAEFQANTSGGDAPERSIVAVEVDAHTESVGPKGPLAKKAERYARLADADEVDALWIVATGGAERLRAIEGVFDAAGLGEWSRVIAHAHVTERPVRDLPTRAAAGYGVGQADPRNPLTPEHRNQRDLRGFGDRGPPAIGGVDWGVSGWGTGWRQGR